MEVERITGNLKTLRELLDSGQINAIEFEAARLAVFRQAMQRDPGDPGGDGQGKLDIPGL